MESYHANEARLKMRDILTSVERGEHVEIKRYDTPTAIVVPVEWYRNMLAVKSGVLAFTRDANAAHWLPRETQLPVGDLMSAIGEAVIDALDKDPEG